MPYAQIIDVASIGPFKITAWGLMVVLGFFLALWAIYSEAIRKKMNGEIVIDLLTWIFIGGIIGGRIGWLITEAHGISFADALKIWNGGMVWYGGFLGGLLAAYLYMGIKKIHFGKYFDLIAVGLPLGQAIGRIGCHLIGDHIGKQTMLPWGINLPSAGGITHPVSLYESLALLGIFFFIRDMSRHGKKRFDGWLFCIYLLLYGIARFLIDFLKVDAAYLGLTIAQYVSLALIAASLITIYFKTKK